MPLEGSCFTGQDEKGGLESVFGVLRLVQNTSSDAPNQSCVSPYERGKGLAIAIGDPTGQELAVRLGRATCGFNESTNVVHEAVGGAGHGRGPLEWVLILSL
jgi:hypothetical protein